MTDTIVYTMFNRLSTSGELYQARSEGKGGGGGGTGERQGQIDLTDMMLYIMIKRFSTCGERHQGKAEAGVGGRHDDLLYVQAIFNKWGTSPG